MNKEYVLVMEHYYAVRDEWFDLTKEERHFEMCACAAKHRKNLLFTCDSAFVIKEVPRLGYPELKPHCLCDKRQNTPDIQWHYGAPDPNAEIVKGLLTVSDIQMICGAATSHTPESLLVSINHCLYNERFTKEQLRSALESRPGMKGGNLLRRLLRFATPKCESPLETITWLTIYKAGLKLPQQQVVIRAGHDRTFAARVDMYWEVRKKKIVLEMDGWSKYKNDKDGETRFKEKIREDKLREQGYEVFRSYWHEIKNGKLVQRLIDKGIPMRRNFTGTFPKRDQ